MDFIVTKKAMRPASDKSQCFYCRADIGSTHKKYCVLITKKITVKMIVEYQIDVPNHWNEKDFLFHRNLGTWCADNSINELENIIETEGCLCNSTTYEYVGNESEPFLDE